MNPGYHVSELAHYEECVRILGRRSRAALTELHPDLRHLVERLVLRMEGRAMPWTGYRGKDEQEAAYVSGRSNARWLESPHNYVPALACDLVLNPARVNVRARTDSPGWPNLWDHETAEAVQAWADLHTMAQGLGLERVHIGRRGRKTLDRPHIQLPGWKQIAGL